MNKSPEEIISLVDPGNALGVHEIPPIKQETKIYVIHSTVYDYCEVYERTICAFLNEEDARLYAEYLESEWNRKNPDHTDINTRTNYYVRPLEILNINEVLLKLETYTDD